MVTRKVRIQIVLFVLIALVGVAYTGARYARLFGASGYVVKMELANSGGIFQNAEVTYRGLAVGRVQGLTLTGNGVEVAMNIDSSAPKIPADLDAVVADRSAVGEQYVDLRPRSDTARPLADGAVIPQDRTTTPLATQTLLTNVDDLARSVPTASLRTVVDQLDTAFSGTGQPLQQLLDTTQAFTQVANQHVPQTTDLIAESTKVLDTQHKEAGALTDFSHNLDLLAQQLKTSDPDIRHLLVAAPETANQLNAVLQEDGNNLGVVIGNLLNTAALSKSRHAALEQTLASAPYLIPIGNALNEGDRLRVGLNLEVFDPMSCTRGYGGTVQRPGNDTTNSAANQRAYCAEPSNSPTDVRGSQNAPHGDAVAVPRPSQNPGTSSSQPAGPGSTVSGTAPTTLAALLGLPS